jgi:hypothetical protein
MRQTLRDNFAIVVGLTLPLVVVLFFVIANRVPRALVEPPRHDLLLLSNTGAYNTRPARIDVHVDGGRLRVRAYRLDYTGMPALGAYSGPMPRIYLWSHESGAVREIPLTLPEDAAALENGADIAVPELEGVRLSTELRAPDGYEFRMTGYGGGFFPFFFDRSSPRPVVTKDGATHEVETPGGEPYWGVQFLAWVVG